MEKITDRKTERREIIRLRGIIRSTVEELFKMESAEKVKLKVTELIPVVAELSRHENISYYLNAFRETIYNELQNAVDIERTISLNTADKATKKDQNKLVNRVINQIAMDIRHLGNDSEEQEEERIENTPGYDPIASQIIGRLSEIQNGGSPDKVYAVIKNIQELMEKHSSPLNEEKEQLQSILKNEMRTFYATRHEKDRLLLTEKLNKILMPAI